MGRASTRARNRSLSTGAKWSFTLRSLIEDQEPAPAATWTPDTWVHGPMVQTWKPVMNSTPPVARARNWLAAIAFRGAQSPPAHTNAPNWLLVLAPQPAAKL